jgi:hypothetical protein
MDESCGWDNDVPSACMSSYFGYDVSEAEELVLLYCFLASLTSSHYTPFHLLHHGFFRVLTALGRWSLGAILMFVLE